MINIFGFLINEITFIISLEILSAIIFLVAWFLYHKNKFTAYLCEPYLNTYKIKKKLMVSMFKEEFKEGDKAFKINFKNAISGTNNKPILFYNIIKALPIIPLVGMGINDDEKEKIKDAKTFKIGLDGDIMKHFASRRLEKMFLYVMLALVVAIIVIAVYSLYSLNQNNAELIILSKKLINITKSLKNNPIIIP